MSKDFEIQSHKGPYQVFFSNNLLQEPEQVFQGNEFVLIDANIADLYRDPLKKILDRENTIIIEATEENKSIEKIIPVIKQLVEKKIRRSHVLVAMGGGILQDITCFIASTLLRGLQWKFIPTTLLAQSDSCIGSKSSINLGDAKNILGTFTPPREIYICREFLDTLDVREVKSGIGEIIKVHAIDSADSFDGLAADFDRLHLDKELLQKYISQALLIKQRYIEEDEFDQGIRNIFNYGHSFGHAIESATHFRVPHGIAVSMGADIANHISMQRGSLSEADYERMHLMLKKNYIGYTDLDIPLPEMLSALAKDKKNTPKKLVFILPIGDDSKITRVEVDNDSCFQDQLQQSIEKITT